VVSWLDGFSWGHSFVYLIYAMRKRIRARGVARRQLHKMLDIALEKGRSPCPVGTTACSIPSDEKACEVSQGNDFSFL